MNTRLGYLVQCEPYQGASASYNATLGLGGSVVSDLMSKMPKGLPYRVFVDNFFTSAHLLDHLKVRGILLTGTVRANRMEKCPLKEVDQLKKECRGAYDHRLDRNSGTLAVRWNNNSVVSMLSNCWQLFKCSARADNQMTLVQFRREIAMCYIMKYRNRNEIGRPPGRPQAISRRVPIEVRFDGTNHFIGTTSTQKRYAQCGMKVKKKCNKCNVGLHDRCFEQFHSR